MPKIIVLNQATVHPSWENMDQLVQSTWGNIIHPDVKIFHYYGAFDSDHNPYSRFSNIPNRGEVITLPNNIMLCGTNDGLGGYFDPRAEKYILALEYCLNNFEFDYVYRTTCTSYIDIYKMYDYFSNLQIKERLYDGSRNRYNYQYFFVTSYHQMLSKDVIEMMVKYKKEFLELRYPEDVATGILITDILKCGSFENLPSHNTSAWALDDNFDPKNYLDTTVFNYRLNPGLGEKLLEIHNFLENNRK